MLKKYNNNNDLEATVKKHMPLVNRAAWQAKQGLPASVELDDLIQSGMHGLLDAARTFSPSLGRPFEAYATMKIKWAIFDELRRSDWLTRDQRDNRRAIDKATETAQQKYGRSATIEEVASEMGMSPGEYQDLLSKNQFAGMLHLEDLVEEGQDPDDLFGAADETTNPLENVSRAQLARNLAGAIDALPEREKIVISLYFYEEMTYREIAEVIEVSTPRAHQILAQALSRLRVALDS